jgi:hypothetical protein
MGRFKSNALVLLRRRPPEINVIREDSPVLLRVQVCNRYGVQKITIRFFSERVRTPPDSFISKNEGMAENGSCKKRFLHEIHRRAAGHAKHANFPLGFVNKNRDS